ncbi:MAG: transposase [Myxococcota bacterium]
MDDPRVELDNNRMERALRGMTLGRKNFYGNWSARGARAAEVAYSVIESAKLAGANPRRYVRHVILASAEDRPILLPSEFRTEAEDAEAERFAEKVTSE